MRLSVAMAAYNGEEYIEEQIDSIVSQMRAEDELIISVNPSFDATEAIVTSYAEKDLSFNTSYTVSSYGFSFMGFGISNRTATGFSATNLTIDQFNNVTGKAHSGKQFAVVYGQAATITVSNTKGVNVKGFFFTNSSYLVNSVENGDDYAKKFADGDYLKVTVTADNGKSVDFYPADYRTGVTVVKDWKWLDLSSLGRVKVLTFTFDGTDKGSWGLNTPSYVCIDDLTYEVE